MTAAQQLRAPHPPRWGITPEQAGWSTLGVDVLHLAAGESEELESGATEGALVILSGRLRVSVSTGGPGSEDGGAQGQTVVHELSRSDVFSEAGSLVYLPPTSAVHLEAIEVDTVCSVGWAPAESGYPTRLVQGTEMRVEDRGRGAARRRVRHLLAHPVPAHRLIVFEVYVPAGGWSGWPPHRHDGVDGSPYLEETYYFRFARPEAFGMHCNYATDPDPDREELFFARDGDLVLVPGGFHFSSASPGAEMYFLNFLAGDLEHADRATPPCFDERHTWIEGAWADKDDEKRGEEGRSTG